MESEQIKRYETEEALNQYLLFHYGNEDDQLPFSFGPKESIAFPVRCVTDCIDSGWFSKNPRALDLGCAVGRSSFELARFCRQVVGVDLSERFIAAAKQIQQAGEIPYTLVGEGGVRAQRLAKRPSGIDPSRIQFRCKDVLEFPEEPFDLVLAANLLCRVPDPKRFLNKLTLLTAPQGELVLISPYSWLKEFTPRSNWLENPPLEAVQKILTPHFELRRTFDMPFLIREHYRKYEWGVSQATIWRRI